MRAAKVSSINIKTTSEQVPTYVISFFLSWLIKHYLHVEILLLHSYKKNACTIFFKWEKFLMVINLKGFLNYFLHKGYLGKVQFWLVKYGL